MPEKKFSISILLWALLTAWLALNVPVARVMGSPLSYGFLHATGAALGDSIFRYVTPANVAMPIVLLVAGFHLWRRPLPAPASARARGAVLLLAATLAILGPFAARRTETLGLYRNAAALLIETTLARGRTADGARLAACAVDPAGASVDLRPLRGLAAGRNVLWVLLESTSARVLTAYGAALEVTPHLAKLARDALVFDHAYAAYPESIKGLFSMLCSRMPPAGTEASDYTPERYPCPAVPALLRRAGYRTALFHSGRFAYLGMDTVVRSRGFEVLRDAATIASPNASSFGVDDRATVRELLAFLDGLPRDARFFAVYLPIAGHHPYRAPGGGPRPFAEHGMRDAYLNDLFSGDDAFGQLRRGLEVRGLDDKTVYVVAGDHGQAFEEHEGNLAHALYLYEENVRVPLLIAAPGRLGPQRRAPQLASLLDLAPTTLALVGLPVPTQYEGRSLCDPGPRMVRFFTEQSLPRAGLREGRYKFLLDEDTGRGRLYDLASDPGERADIAAAHPERVARYRACLRQP